VRLAIHRNPGDNLRPIARAKIRKSGGALGGRGIATGGLILGYIALVLGIMGVPLLVSMIQSDQERLQRLSTERKEIASDDGKIKVALPGTWYSTCFTNDRWSSSPTGRTHGNRKRHQRCLPSHHRGRRRSFSTNPRLDIEIEVARTGSTAARSDGKFSQRKVTSFTRLIRARHPIGASAQITFGSLPRQLSSTLLR